MQNKKTLQIVLIVAALFGASTLVQAAPASSSSEYEEVSYDDLLNELSAKKKTMARSHNDSLDATRIHAGIGYANTFSNISTMVYGSMPQVLNAANKVRASHKEIKGKIPYRAGAFHKDSAYGANEVNAMVWVHATLWETLVYMYEELEEPLTQAEKDRFYEETKLFAMLFGIPESALPRNWNEFMAYNEAMWYSSQLTVTDNARKLKEDLFTPRSIWLVFPLWIQEVVTASNIPAPIREGYQMDYGLWERFNNAWLMGSAEFTSWILPDYLGVNPVDHEAHARLEGKRNDYFHRKQIEAVMGTDRLVN